MSKKQLWILMLGFVGWMTTGTAQTIPGDSIVFGPMFSPVYHDSVRVWVVTKQNTGSGDVFSLELTAGNAPGTPLTGTVHNSDDRLGYQLRSWVYPALIAGQAYTAVIKKNGVATHRKAVIKNESSLLDDFSFLTGGCGRIYDTTRCIDRPESQTHKNGDPAMFNRMAAENSDLMIWLGDATYLLGLQHAMGQCPNGIDDWANKDMAFARYMFYRNFHDSLTRAMPQLAIPDNHDLGPNEFNKTLPTIGQMREIFMDWWPNPAYKSTSEGQGLYSSYQYKDVEYFLLDNRSYRDGTTQHLGPEQFEWLKQGLKQSKATFKILINGTPSFAKHWGGRNFSITSQGDELVKWIKDQNIDGVLCFSADIHEQELYGRYADVKYPLFDMLSGNLNSDVGNGQFTVDYASDRILRGVKQTYLKVTVYGEAGNRKMRVAYTGPDGLPYFQSVIHSDMLKSIDDSVKKLSLGFSGSLLDSSAFQHQLTATGLGYGSNKDGVAQSAGLFSAATNLQWAYTPAFDLQDRPFTLGFWINPSQFPATGAAVFSNATAGAGITIGFDKDGYLQYIDHKTNTTYTSTRNLVLNKWAQVSWKYDNVRRQLSVFYNGWLVQAWTGVVSPSAATGALHIGNNFENKHFIGLLDEVKLYGKLVSDQRILDNAGYTSHRGDVIKLNASNMAIPGAAVNTAMVGDFTIEFWGKVNTDPGANIKLLASNGRVNNNTTGISFEFPDNNKLNVVLGTNTSSWSSLTDKGNAWNVGEWNHIAVTATKNGTLTYYVNGEKVADMPFTAYVPNNWGIGLGNSPAYAGTLAAELDELRIWSKALPADSIRRHMHHPLTGKEDGLALNYDFKAYTDTSIMSTGTQPVEIKLSGAEIVSATSPVAVIDSLYQQAIAANWSISNKAIGGLSYTEKITGYISNIVTGKNPDSTLAVTKNNIHYLKGGWQIDALNVPAATIKVILAQALPKADSIVKAATRWYLLEELTTDSLVIVSQGNFDGQNLTFINTYLEPGYYHLGWLADPTGAIGRGGALSLTGGHKVHVPDSKVDAVLSGKFTIEYWAKLTEDPVTSAKMMASNGRINNNTVGFAFEFNASNALNAVFGTNTGNWNSIASNVVWKVGEWNHIAVTGAPNDSLKMYVNGTLAGKNAFTAYAPGGAWDLALGNSTNYTGNEMKATMDEFRIWKKVKTQQEIVEGMHLSTATDTALVFNYTFNQDNIGYAINTGTGNDSISMTNAQIIASTAPVADMDTAYRTMVTANWSLRNETANGLYLKDAITGFNTNLVVGKDFDKTIVKLGAAKDTFYVKGGWWLNALDMKTGTLVADLAKILTNADSVAKFASRYYLIKGDPAATYTIVASAPAVNKIVEFANVSLDFGKYFLGYKSSAAAPVTAVFKITAGTDDAEQNLDINSGAMDLTSSDLEFTKDGTKDQFLGVRFSHVTIPQGAIVNNAYIQFTVDEVNTTGDVNVMIGVENTDNPLTMTTGAFDIYHRLIHYGDTLIWKPGQFAAEGDSGINQRTTDLSKLVQHIVNRPSWASGNPMLFAMVDPAYLKVPGYTGNTDKRVAQSFDRNPATAARLVVNYTVPNRFQTGTFPLAMKASWKYNDTADLSGRNWTAVDYNDSTWAFGNGILGYGEGNESTTLQYGNDANNKRPTYYFRHTFKVDDRTKYDSLVFDVLRDDGAIVYVNGTEAFRMNMPDGTVNYNTYATATVNAPDETAYFRTKTANLLQNGINVIAVELHQATANSSDLSFDMQVGYTLPPLAPASYPLTKGSEWSYLDNGTSLDAAAWKDSAYADRHWATGKGPLGYGDAMTTTVSYGPDATNKYITTYFRRGIVIDTAHVADSVEIGIRRDDGVILYINGNEVVRDNMPAGAVNYRTKSSSIVDGAAETTYFTFLLPKTIFRNGHNQLAAEVHNRDSSSSDLGFDLYIKDAPVKNPPFVCADNHIACFTSIDPTAQTNKLIIPAGSHRFQLIFKEGEVYTKGSGTVPGNHDFTGYVPLNGSSTKGHLSVNHENQPGGVSMIDLHYNDTTMLWVVDTTQAVDFYNNDLITTTRNCSGGITPWGTVITSEESVNAGDVNKDGYEDVGWQVEIDPLTAKVLDYNGDGKQDKLWAMGRMNHENIVVLADRKTAYYGEDGGTHCVYKFVADKAGDLSAGKVYVLKLDQPLVNDDPSGTTAQWILVPNATQSDRNNLNSIAASLGGTNFNGVEDCEISPIDGKIYFTSKGKNRVYRFTDKGTSVDNFETFVGGTSYTINTASGAKTEPWGDGNDNLTFDNKGNLWVLQDGGLYYIWVIRPDHTQSSPKVELFASFPAGSEPTGLTFSPDHRFGFVSVQHPSGSNADQVDASGKTIRFNKSATLVFSLNEHLGMQIPVAGFTADTTVAVVGKPVKFTDTSKNYPTSRAWKFDGGSPATSTNTTETVTYHTPGKYKVELIVSNAAGADTAIAVDYIEVKNAVTGINDPDDLAKSLTVSPNPTNGRIMVTFRVPAGEQVSMELFDLSGKRLGTLATVKATGLTQQVPLNLEPLVKTNQVVVLLVRTATMTNRKLLLYTK
ncbi:DUF839 domain-containing protein [Pseudoflavitalea sp. X16]|uniref:LamG-like jellyroll fold domain-containing protein n=1 Tax=Paraflavitalea devenefica TaxID=2716334 RepID=UPI001421BDBD|nr:LamG-like jellyroll fold domain-containing protein [Paraflavitalea devenefica]NII28819.1 DUF839 domain-containing protein [Paraflavitalea devenefica]